MTNKMEAKRKVFSIRLMHKSIDLILVGLNNLGREWPKKDRKQIMHLRKSIYSQMRKQLHEKL